MDSTDKMFKSLSLKHLQDRPTKQGDMKFASKYELVAALTEKNLNDQNSWDLMVVVVKENKKNFVWMLNDFAEICIAKLKKAVRKAKK